MPLLTAREHEPVSQQRRVITGPIVSDDMMTKFLILFINVGLVFKVMDCPELIFVLVTMQPIFCLLFFGFFESQQDEPVPPGVHSETNVSPGVHSETNAGLQANEHLSQRVVALADSAMPRWGWWARVKWWKFGFSFGLLLASTVLLYVCSMDPGLLLLYSIAQPLLVLFGFKWIWDHDTADALKPQLIKLERVASDDAADVPHSCAICLGDFDDPESGSHADSAQASATEQNIVLVDGVGTSGWRSNEIVRLQCDRAHCFHAGCIQAWLKTNGTCPLCRSWSGEQVAWWLRLYKSCAESSIVANTVASLT